MSTKIERYREAGREVGVIYNFGNRVDFGVVNKDDREITCAVADYDNFIAAVEKELCGTFIPDSELPEVRAIGDRLVSTDKTSGAATAKNAQYWRECALHYLALAKHLESHPPVDEAEVTNLADVIAKVRHGDACTASDLAQRLVAAGVRVGVDK